MPTEQDAASVRIDPAAKPAIDLATIPEEELLGLRLSELPVRIEGTWLEACIAQLHDELKARNILFEPGSYLADEWLTPENEPVIGIPFYLAHPRLIKLQKKMLLEAEGDNHDWCMKLLRHECGHALTYAYGLNRKRSWQRVFGHPSEAYPETYRFRPYSKSFVRHLDYYYAQYHPDEDFVETFAVWLTPGLDWRSKYAGWKALEKLEFVDKLMTSIAGKAPLRATGRRLWKVAAIRSTLRRYYQKRRITEAEDFPEFHDANLRRMFSEGNAKGETRKPVAKLLQSHRKSLLTTVSNWTGERRFMVNEVYKAVLQRSRALRLVTEDAEPVAVLQLATYLTTLMMNYRYTTRLRGSFSMATRVLLVFDLPYAVKPGYDFTEEFADPEGSYTENDVYQALLACGYEVHRLSLFDDVRPLLDAVRDVKPDVIFNLCDTFHEVTHWDKNILATIELLGVPCTGASSSALFLCNDKALSKKILRFHRVRTPRFHTFYGGHKVWLPKTLKLPCIIKPLTEEASRGISQASIVDDEASFIARVKMIHERMNLDAIAEEYIDGRELYVSIIGDRALRMLPAREMTFGQMDEDEPRIATYKAKWDDKYRKRWGIKNHFANALEPELQKRIGDICKRAYRALNLRSYARFDLRVTAAGQIYVVEPNVNPCIAKDDELAQSALKAGIAYPSLIRKVVNQALRRVD